jgi:hypothetical protein
VIAIASRWSANADVDRFAKRFLTGSPVQLVRDPAGTIARAYGIESHPHFVALDARGHRIGDGYRFPDVLAQARFDASKRT